MYVFSIENYISQQIIHSLKRTNNLFTQFYLKNLWESTVINQPYLKRPVALVCFWKKRKQLLKKTKQTNQLFLFSIKAVISAAQDRWPLGLSVECIYNHLFGSTPKDKRLSKKAFHKFLQEKEKNYQQAIIIFFEEVKMHFFYTVSNESGQNNFLLRRIFFDAVLSFLQDPKLQKAAIKAATRKSKSHCMAAHKIKDIKKTFYELAKKDMKIRESADSSFKNVA